MMSNRPAQTACLAASPRPAPIFRMACTNPASPAVPSAMQYSSHAIARTRTPPGGNTAAPSTRSAVMNCASLPHSSPKRPASRRLALYSKVMCDISGVLSRTLVPDGHRRDGAAHREDRNGAVIFEAAEALRGRRDADEGADLEPSLAGIPVRRLVRVGQHRLLVVGLPAPQEFPVPRFVDLSGVRCRRPVRNAARADQGDAFG